MSDPPNPLPPTALPPTLPADATAPATAPGRQTMRPTRAAPLTDALDGLRVDEPLKLGGVLGRGGMGTVYAAEQAALGRTVAVKVPDGAPGDPAVAAMVAEAVVTGQLEHPGIVPVHALDLDAEGRPRLVLKRIEGQSWTALLAGQTPETRGDEQLAEHLRIWLRVAEALSFAHARGVIHRDIKPDNVMVGAFGEVYLLDWGVAATLDDAADPRIPRLKGQSGAAGTPSYMAPEQAAGMTDLQGPATDVFLLGATLYEILSGRTPNQGRTPMAMLVAASRGQIEPLPAAVDPDLAALCRAALSHAPADRPPTVAAFAEQIRRWIEQRPARRVLAEAARRVARLEAAVGQGPARALIEAEFEAIRASLTQIEALLPDSAVDDLRGRAAVAMARIALADGDPDGAERRLALPGTRIELPLRQALAAAIATARLDLARRQADLERRDPGIGRHLRGWMALVLGALWVALPAISAARGEVPPLDTVALGNFGLGALMVVLLFVRRRSLLSTVPNRLLLLAWFVATFVFAGIELWGHHRGVDPRQIYALQLLIVGILAVMVAIGVETRAWPIVIGAGVTFGLGAWRPAWIMALTSINNFVICGTLVWLSLVRERRLSRPGGPSPSAPSGPPPG